MAKESVKGKAYARVDISHDELIALAIVFWVVVHEKLVSVDVTTLHWLESFSAKMPSSEEIDLMVSPEEVQA